MLLISFSHVTRVFLGNMKREWRNGIRKFQFKHPGETVTKKHFASVLKEVWDIVAKPELAMGAFLDAGI